MIRTKINERFFNNLIGSSVDDTLFELNNSYDSSYLREEIITLLKNFEQRISLTNVFIENDLDSNDLFIQIEYDIVGIPLPTQNIEFILQPTRI